MKAGFAIALLAVAVLCTYVMAEENTSDSWYKKSQRLSNNGSYEESIKAIDNAIDLSPRNSTLWDAKASSLAFAASFSGNISEYNESLKAQDKAIELAPKNSTLLVHKGFLIANLADLSGQKNESMYEEAIKEFNTAIELDPLDKEAWNWKGVVLDTRLNRSSEALAAYDRSIEIDGKNASDKTLLANAWRGKGMALAKLGRYNESLETSERAMGLNPEIAPFVWNDVGQMLNDSGRYDEAVKAYDESVELSRENVTSAQAYEGKGMALFKLGKYDEAAQAYEKATELSPMNAPVWYRKGDVLKLLGRQAEADDAFAHARELGYNA